MSEIQEKLSIGNCQCIDKFNKHLIVSVLKEKIDNEKNYIRKIEYDRKFYEMREKYSAQYASADALIRIHKRIIETTELVLKRVENTNEC
jgi:hypothetical protein